MIVFLLGAFFTRATRSGGIPVRICSSMTATMGKAVATCLDFCFGVLADLDFFADLATFGGLAALAGFAVCWGVDVTLFLVALVAALAGAGVFLGVVFIRIEISLFTGWVIIRLTCADKSCQQIFPLDGNLKPY